MQVPTRGRSALLASERPEGANSHMSRMESTQDEWLNTPSCRAKNALIAEVKRVKMDFQSGAYTHRSNLPGFGKVLKALHPDAEAQRTCDDPSALAAQEASTCQSTAVADMLMVSFSQSCDALPGSDDQLPPCGWQRLGYIPAPATTLSSSRRKHLLMQSRHRLRPH